MKDGQSGGSDGGSIAFDDKKCVLAVDRYATCALCAEGCPSGALSRNGSVTFHADACVQCGLCLHLCPLGAFSGDDSIEKLAGCAARLERRGQIELACARHPAPELGPGESEAVIVAEGCLAALGPSAYLALLAQGHTRILARLDACAACAQGKAREGIEQALAVARALGGPVDALCDGAETGWVTRPLVRAAQPPLSRRDFLRTFAAHGQALAAQAVAPDDEPDTGAKRPPRERRRLLNVLGRLPATGERFVDAAPFARARVGAACTACGACARACPTGALQLRQGPASFQLTFAAARCTACGACADVCEPQVLRLERGASLGELRAAGATTAWEGTVHKCARCGAPFASAAGNPLCPLCEFRQNHPFGSRLPARARSGEKG